MLKKMRARTGDELILLLDTCAEQASVALVRSGGALVGEQILEPRTASAALLGAVRAVFGHAGVGLAELAGVGVVHGPGSFTGVRVGLALAKGLCEAALLPLAAVSRLAVLAEAAGDVAIAAVSAGRDQVYVRLEAQGEVSERLMGDRDLMELCGAGTVAVDSPELRARLGPQGMTQLVEIRAADAAGPVMRQLARDSCDSSQADANYVRDEAAIYRRSEDPKIRRSEDPKVTGVRA